MKVYSKDFSTFFGTLDTTIEAFVEEERNGLFELRFVCLNTDSLFSYIEKDNIVVANANDTLLNQKFRIYLTRKLMNNRVEVFARHISFDLMYDYIDSINLLDKTCEYSLNYLFSQSVFSKHFKGYSDIVNHQNYIINGYNVLESIAGSRGSIIDTFGNGAELLRDNENIHVLSKRGKDNQVTIEYRKNLTGFELEEDLTELVTRIKPYAKHTVRENNKSRLAREEEIVSGRYVDSPYIGSYAHPYIRAIDYSDKFRDGEVPTTDKLEALALNEYKDNKIDIPKQNFKVEFIPLSKCIGYEGINDNISLCDIVTIKDSRYNVDIKANVIKVIFNVLKNRYEAIELGNYRNSMGDILDDLEQGQVDIEDKLDKVKIDVDQNIGKLEITIKDETGKLETQIKQTAEEISQRVTNDEFESYKSQTAEEISEKVTAGDVSSIVKQNATSWGISINGKLSGTNYTFDGNNFSIGKTNSGDKAEHNNQHSKWMHSDGSYTQADATGFKKYESGTGKTYHYYLKEGTALLSHNESVYIDVPNHILAKKGFTVTIAQLVNPGNTSTAYMYSLNNVVVSTFVHNGKLQIQAFLRWTMREGTYTEEGGLVFVHYLITG